MARSRKTGRVNTKRRIYRLIKPLLKRAMEQNFCLSPDLPDEVRTLAPPYLVLPNHQGFWDGVMVGVYLPHPVFYIATDASFRSPLMRLFLKIEGVIPKTKGLSDMESLRSLIRVKEAGGVIGIFPEAVRTWDGTTGPILFSVARLIRFLKIPVVTTVIQGGYFTDPRWALKKRKGEVVVSYRLNLSAEEAASLPPEEIHERISTALAHDEYRFIEEKYLVFEGENRAENLEQALFLCPACCTVGSLRSKGDRFFCEKCGYILTFTPEQRFCSDDNKVFFDTIRDWYAWQQGEYRKILARKAAGGEPLAGDKNLSLLKGYKSEKPRFLAKGSLRLSSRKLSFQTPAGEQIQEFLLNELEGIEAQNGESLEFYHRKTLYIIRSGERRMSVNKWLQALEFAGKLSGATKK